jgi:hypothetical protein
MVLMTAACVVIVAPPVFIWALAACAASGWFGYRIGRARRDRNMVEALAVERRRAAEWEREANDRGDLLEKALAEVKALTVTGLHQKMDRGPW